MAISCLQFDQQAVAFSVDLIRAFKLNIIRKTRQLHIRAQNCVCFVGGGRLSQSFPRRGVQSTWWAVEGCCTPWEALPWWRMRKKSAHPLKSSTFGSMFGCFSSTSVHLNKKIIGNFFYCLYYQVWRGPQTVERHDQRDALCSWSIVCLHAPESSKNAQTVTMDLHFNIVCCNRFIQ